MRIASQVLVVSALAAAVVVTGTALAGKDEIKPCVKFAKTWEAAVTEAKTLNLPLVVHSHGFY